MKKALPYILIIIAEIFWGLSFIWTKVLINLEIPVFVFTFSRMFIAALVMLVLCKSFGVLQRIDRKDIPSFLLCALLHPFLYYICETFSLKATGSPTLCALFSSLVPVFVMIAALVFFKTTLTWKGIDDSGHCLNEPWQGRGFEQVVVGFCSAFWLSYSIRWLQYHRAEELV